MAIQDAATRRLAATVALAGLSGLAACGGGGGGPVGNGGNSGSFTARIDGANWASAVTSGGASAGGNFALGGVQTGSGTAITMTLYSIAAPGTYPLGVGPSVTGGTATVTSGSSIWSTGLSGAAGTVTVTAVSPTRVAGTFTFNAPPLIGQTVTNTRAVTAGTFDVPITSGPATLVVPDYAGSKVTGTVAGTAFNAATVVTVTAPSSGTFTFGASNSAQTMNVIISGYTGVGSYTLGTGASRTVSVTNTVAPTGSWGGSNANTTGTLTITSATSTRIKGTLTATVQPIGSLAPAATTLNVTFEIGIATP